MNHYIIEKLESIEKMLTVQTLVKKEVLTSREAAIYLGLLERVSNIHVPDQSIV